MKYLLWICLCLGMGFSSCQEDENFQKKDTNLPSFSSIVISEVQTGDAQPVTWNQTLHYNGSARLISVEMSQTYTAVELQQLKETARFDYSENQACLTDDNGNRWTYQLDENHGMAVSCLYQPVSGSARNYRFFYHITSDGSRYLSKITERLAGSSQVFSSLDIEYSLENTSLITKEVNGIQQQFQMVFFAENTWKNQAQLPPYFLLELYPLSQHTAAMYAHLLGAYPSCLLQSVVPLEDIYGEKCIYSYKMESGFPVSCDIEISSMGKTYLRHLSICLEK